MSTPRPDPYPEVTARGGLAAAMREAATLRGRDIGSLSPTPDGAVTETTRGYVSIDPAAGERLFRLSTGIPGFAWAIGATGDLELLVDAVAAWRAGMPFDALEAEFAFLDLAGLTGALAAGEPAASQWSRLLATEFHREQWDLLRLLRADVTLRGFYPDISHRAVRLQVDGLDATSRQVLVADPGDGPPGERYEVRVGEPGATWAEVPAADLTAYLRRRLTGR
ncbi:hypothetical protein [Streptomyces sp. NPDC048560]|uniref:hypothetical protein n=1 Tax=Streptomyces sp. NPDC048560 TaxID=3155488 RepID=UPI0034121C48